MRKFLCIIMGFVAFFSIYAMAEENMEEAISNIVTYGPISFDISDKWEVFDSNAEENWMDISLKSTSRDKILLYITIQDVWHSVMSEEKRTEYEASGFFQEDFDFVEIAHLLMTQRAEEESIDADTIEILQIAERDFCKLIIPYSIDYYNIRRVFDMPIYGTVENGYYVTFDLYTPNDSDYHECLINILDSLSIDMVDSFIICTMDSLFSDMIDSIF